MKVHVNDTICICKDLDNWEFFIIMKREMQLYRNRRNWILSYSSGSINNCYLFVIVGLIALIFNFHSSDDNDTCKIDSPVFINVLVDSTHLWYQIISPHNIGTNKDAQTERLSAYVKSVTQLQTRGRFTLITEFCPLVDNLLWLKCNTSAVPLLGFVSKCNVE